MQIAGSNFPLPKARPAAPAPFLSTLTGRERQVADLIATGCTNRLIGKELGITEESVKRHISNIFDKTGFGSRHELTYALLMRDRAMDAVEAPDAELSRLRNEVDELRTQLAALRHSRKKALDEAVGCRIRTFIQLHARKEKP